MAVPHILPESQVGIFKFYDKNAIHEAVIVNGKIMRLTGIFSAIQKREAFNFAYGLSQKYFTPMTPGADRCRVWVDVRCETDLQKGIHDGYLAPEWIPIGVVMTQTNRSIFSLRKQLEEREILSPAICLQSLIF